MLPDADKRGPDRAAERVLEDRVRRAPARHVAGRARVGAARCRAALRDAGVEYVLVDDQHFALAGLSPDELGGYYLTEEQGATVGVFPINERLRYLIPFAEVEKSIEYLGEQHGRGRAVTVVDDGEKFGVWPGTFKHVYEDGWLDALLRPAQRDPVAAVGHLRRRRGRASRPPGASICRPRRTGRWASGRCPPTRARALEEAQARSRPPWTTARGWSACCAAASGGTSSSSIPEVADDLLEDAAAVARRSRGRTPRRPDDPRCCAAREALWRGQANDAYWHGVFGGCYLPHLRRAVKTALLEAEARAGRAAPLPLEVTVRRRERRRAGRDRACARPSSSVTLNPARGGTLTELGCARRAGTTRPTCSPGGPRPITHASRAAPEGSGATRSIGDTTPEKEPGLHRLLAYDRFRRASLLDGLFAVQRRPRRGGAVGARADWRSVTRVFEHAVERRRDGVEIVLRLRGDHPELRLRREARDGRRRHGRACAIG